MALAGVVEAQFAMISRVTMATVDKELCKFQAL